ncbi:glycosyltransferase [Candidatus Woesebacteria bacterium]|nr:glycosyltransferase [Candidatus Woesebacteria bacterium]MCD8507195.1 glycosyltransferase [Candidatus Woesebacteria bacterium]MCD8526810.1 glycosyltransferase [Candidatus Woesebacteria bacterium]MCD8545969.1 glycosyltransferase [Candidatus Woesebacteria bacterium]
MKVALVHDYLREYGGAERVLETLHEMFPDAPVYVAFYDADRLGPQAQRFADWDIRETVLTRFPFYKRLASPYRVFSAWAFQQLDLSEYDVVISSTNMYMAKAVRTRSDAKHISYVHTPPRSLYGHSTMSDWKKNPLVRVGGELINFWMRYVDFQTAQNPDILIANSTTTQQRISKYYRRDSVVIYPPIQLVDRKLPVLPKKERTHLLYVNRLGFSKHPEISVQVANHLGLPLQVVGTGAMENDLHEMAGPTVNLLGSVDDETLVDLYQHAEMVLYPVEDEDFGMIPIEAMAAGTPVIAHFSGEPRFTVQDGVNGVHVRNFAVQEWIETVREAREKKWSYKKIQQTADQYSLASFVSAVEKLIHSSH